MCRFAAWIGEPQCLAGLVCDPEHGLISQARSSREALMDQHPDGAGLLWYTDGQDEPQHYLNASPAWLDPELTQVAQRTQSSLFLAHVRAATRAARCLQNCHPFRHGRLSFMHNGELAPLDALEPVLRQHCGDAEPTANATDSELIFALLRCYGALDKPEAALSSVIALIRDTAQQIGVAHKLRLSAVLSDGNCLRVVRYASDSAPPSLYVRQCHKGVAIASEPIGGQPAPWTALAINSLTTATATGVESRAFNP